LNMTSLAPRVQRVLRESRKERSGSVPHMKGSSTLFREARGEGRDEDDGQLSRGGRARGEGGGRTPRCGWRLYTVQASQRSPFAQQERRESGRTGQHSSLALEPLEELRQAIDAHAAGPSLEEQLGEGPDGERHRAHRAATRALAIGEERELRRRRTSGEDGCQPRPCSSLARAHVQRASRSSPDRVSARERKPPRRVPRQLSSSSSRTCSRPWFKSWCYRRAKCGQDEM